MFPAVQLAVVFCLVAAAATKCHNGRIINTNTFTPDAKAWIVYWHNTLRNRVAAGQIDGQPSAENMRELTWDDELEAMSQHWANKCIFQHDSNLINKKGQPVGQNLFLYRSTDKSILDNPDFEYMINEWFNEVYLFGYNGTFTKDSGHYSQIIWGGTKKIGCGYTAYQSGKTLNSYLVCNYFPAGNVAGQHPYDYGNANCEDHEMFRSSSFSDLCDINKYLLTKCYTTSEWVRSDQNSSEQEADSTTTISS